MRHPTVEQQADRDRRGVASDPEGAVPLLNSAFVDVQQDRDGEAAERMEHLISTHPPTDKTLLCTALRVICDLDLSKLQTIVPPRSFGRD